MRKFTEEHTFWVILWSIFLIVLGVMIGAGLSCTVYAVEYRPVRHSERCFAEDVEIAPVLSLEEPQIQPLQVAEPLYGEELYRFYISQINEQYFPDVDPYVALAVLENESNYQPNAMSSVGAVGLMQWIPKWHAWRMEKFHLNDMWDPYTNIIVGMDYLNDLFQSSGSWKEALYGYNHSMAYVNAVLYRAELLRGGGCFG